METHVHGMYTCATFDGLGLGLAQPSSGFTERTAIMAHVISDECIMCGACVSACPEEAIEEGDPKYVIDPEKCTDCGTCVDECPSEAISPVD